ncbi:MAG: DUF615 domain-containing protein [Burkholderiaceae bacterium]|nr:DUF615 domain-containing protein [Burkholderiaceae bacterium]
MPRKPKKGYFVAGRFIAEGSEEAREREPADGEAASRSERKRASTRLQQLGAQLLLLRPERLARLALPEPLTGALDEARRIRDFEGRRRQLQFIGKLMRQLDAAALEAIRAVLDEQQRGSAGETMALHEVEQWRARLIADDAALSEWVQRYPQSDSQQVRALLRQARHDARPGLAGQAPRHGKAYRELFQLVRAQLHEPQDNQEPPIHASHRSDL